MKLGDHVRALADGEYRHAVDCGDRTVLFLARDGAERSEVRRALAADFASGAERVEAVVHREPVHAPRAVVARAFSRLRDPAAALSFATSEAFAVWCLTGRSPEPSRGPARAPAARRAAATRARRARRVPARAAASKRRAARGRSRGRAAARRPPKTSGKGRPRRGAGRRRR